MGKWYQKKNYSKIKQAATVSFILLEKAIYTQYVTRLKRQGPVTFILKHVIRFSRSFKSLNLTTH